MYKVLNIDPYSYSQQAKDCLAALGKYKGLELSRKHLLDVIHDYDALICRFGHQIDREVINRAERLQVIGTNVTGFDHIDVACLDEHQIKLFTLRDFPDIINKINSTAELTWGLLIGLSRRMIPAANSALTGQILRDNFVGTDLKGKTLGILGLGRIGKKVAQYGKAFDMRVISFTLPPHPDIDGVEVISSEQDFLSQSHVLTIHLPLDACTKNYLNHKRFAQLPSGAVVINTSRSAILCENSLIAHLKSGHLAGAALDVYEPLPTERFENHHRNSIHDYAKTHSNLLLTPHIGGVTTESWATTELTIANAVASYLHKEK